MKKNIAVIMGGHSSEYQISLKSGKVVCTYLDKDKFNVFPILISREKWVYIDPNKNEYPINRHDFSVEVASKRIGFDCVFNAIHGAPGENGIMQAYFELLGLCHTSCDHYPSALTFNKRDLISTLRPYGIKAAASFFLDQGDTVDTDKIVDTVGLPCFVKANKAGSSFGISKVYKKEHLPAAIEKAFAEDNEILIEQALQGTEVSVGVITHKGTVTVLPITEIISENDFFDYEAKYEGKSQEITPARISDIQAETVREVSKKIYRILKMKGFTRSEFILQGDTPYLLEVNTTPGLTEESLLPQQAKAAGIALTELFENAIDEALRENA